MTVAPVGAVICTVVMLSPYVMFWVLGSAEMVGSGLTVKVAEGVFVQPLSPVTVTV